MKKGSSWFSAVKKAFRSCSKDKEKQEKETEKKKWRFRKNSNSNSNLNQGQENDKERRHVIALAVAASATAEATVVAANAAAEVARLTRKSAGFLKEHRAALAIQTAFRGYLARRALGALKGIVKLQAIIRGDSVRKRADITLKCMHAIVRVQAKVREQKMKLSEEGSSTKSSPSCNSSLWDSKYMQDVSDKKSTSSCFVDDLEDQHRTIREVQEMLQSSKETAAMKREKMLSSYAFSLQERKPSNNLYQTLREEEERQEKIMKQITARSPVNIQLSTKARVLTSPQRKHVEILKDETYQTRKKTHNNPLYTSSNTASITGYYNYNGTGVTRNQPALPNYMTTTESARARSTPRQRSATPERDRAETIKKRFPFPVMDACYSHNFKNPGFKYEVKRADNKSFLLSNVSPTSVSDITRWMF